MSSTRDSLWNGAFPVSRSLRRQQCGIVLGGLGTGGVEIWDDGGLHIWQIFNNGTFVAGRFRTPLPSPMPSQGLFLTLRTIDEHGRAGLWQLQMPDLASGEWIEMPYHVPELRFPASIRFFGRQPYARLEFELEDCPVEAVLDASTPLVVHDLDASAWPVAELTLRLRNTSDQAVSVAAVASLANCIGGYPSVIRRPHQVHADEVAVSVYMPPPESQDAQAGSMLLTAFGLKGELSFCRKWSAIDINPGLFFQQLEADNRLGGDESKIARRMALAERLEELGWGGTEGRISDLPEERLEELAAAARGFHECRILEQELSRYAGARSIRQARDLMLQTFLRRIYAKPPFYGSVARTMELPAGQSGEASFQFAWSFPHHRTPAPRRPPAPDEHEFVDYVQPGNCCGGGCCAAPAETSGAGASVGHRYSMFGDTALDLGRAYRRRRDDLQARSAAFTAALYDTSFPEWLCDAVNAQFTSLVTNSWYTRDGRFALWPGSGCCGFSEIGTGFFATIPLVLMFPRAAMDQLEAVVRLQAADGRIPHAFGGNFEELTVYYDDDYLKFPLQVYRDWVWTGDDNYLKRMWPRLVEVMQAIERLDEDGDGIPDVRGHNQDYDQWMMFGLGCYTASHWPIALRMMARMGEAVGQTDRCAEWRRRAEQAAERMEEDLWTGEYYRLYVDRRAGKRSDALLVNNLCGEWYARLTGLPSALRKERIVRNLKEVFIRNRTPGMGMLCGWFPPGERRVSGTRDWHWRTCWLGAEYAAASHMIYEGLVEEGLTACREGHERHHRQGLRYNHFECGEHYTRALDVWAVWMALQGLEWDAPAGRLTFRPMLGAGDHRSLLLLPGGWGTVQQRLNERDGAWRLRLMEGQLRLAALRLDRAAGSARIDRRELAVRNAAEGIQLAQPEVLRAGQELVVAFAG